MSLDSQTYILFSLTADVILGIILLFLWVRQRYEWHALYWAGGQIALTAGTASLFLGAPDWPRHLIGAVTLALSAAGFWAGTESFLGKLKRRHLRPALLATLLFGAAMYTLWNIEPGWQVRSNAAAIGLAILYAGCRLVAGPNRYRFLGATLVVRGLINLAIGAGMVPFSFELWFAFSMAIKTASMLCLIYAVQEKIQQRYTHTIDSLSNGFLVHDRDGFIHVANERCAVLMGYARSADMVGSHIADHVRGGTRAMVADYFQRFEAATAYPLVETVIIRLPDGNNLPVETFASPYFEAGRLYCMVQLLDITERKKKDDLLYRAARYDNITGFFNRYGLAQELAARVARAAQAGGACAVLFIDLDKFKRVNDSFGHAVGDQLLHQMAQRLHDLLRPDDILARFGGDEFVIVMADLAAGAAPALASACGARVLAALGTDFALPYQSVRVSASIGMACYPEHGADADALVRNADIAMYDVKKHGRGEMRFFDEGMNAQAKEALVIDAALRGAIAAGELRLVYQAIVDAGSLRMRKMEALLRWHSAVLGPVSPDRFITVAEDSGLIVELGTWVLNEACRQLGRWRAELGDLTVSINVSARQLVDPAFIGLVERALADNGLAAHQLELELTERVLIDDGASVRAALGRLSALGISISLDDFGTGYSSLSYLTQFHINTLKIDRSFVTDIEHSERGNKLVATIVAMGHSLGLELVAEGVETAGQAAILEKMGCHYLQGYHISRPLAPEALLKELAERA